MPIRNISKNQTFRYKAALIFALTSILPLLLFLFILVRHGLIRETEAELVLGMSVVIAGLGFVFFQQTVKKITTLAEDFLRLERGEIEEIGKQDDPQEVSEMARIADAFNKILTDLKGNTKELENLIYKLSTLSELTELVSRIPNIEEVLETVLHRAMMTVNAKIGSIMLLDNNNGTLSIVASEGLDESVGTDTTIRLGEGIAGKVAQTGEPMLVEDVERNGRFNKANDPKYGASSFISMPLRAQDRIIGVLNLSKKGDQKAFSESDLKFLNTLLSHISFAVENARLLKEAKESAISLQELVQEKTLQLDKAQQQVLQAAKLSSLGELVAGVTHELNNPLSTMMGYSQLLMRKVEDEKMRRDLKKIFDEAERAAKIVQNLLSFARQDPPEKGLWDINDVVSKALEMAAYELDGADIEVTTEHSADLPPTMVDAQQLQQVFLNIVNNARQAMMEQEQPKKLRLKTEKIGKRLWIEITDTGPGIPSEQLERIFDPFFTTKPKDKGTGLGLSISYGIVKAHDGDIYVKSHVGEGTTFLVGLPIQSETTEPIVEETREPRATQLPIQDILIIDDEQNVTDLITDILTEEGYHVDTAHGGNQALVKLMEEEYDLIICDLRMPETNGQRVYEWAKLVKPEITPRFIFLTGDIMGQETRGFLEDTGNLCIIKPFTDEILLDVISQTWRKITGEKETTSIQGPGNQPSPPHGRSPGKPTEDAQPS
jgi:signal transduction histidine kinase/CheY-like chemotaxis protein